MAGGCDEIDLGGDARADDAAADGDVDRGVLDADVDADRGAPDAAPDCGPLPECTEVQRRVGCGCVSVYDRRCETDADCRATETCRAVEGAAPRVCWFEPPRPVVCPGGPACRSNEGPLQAGAARRTLNFRFEQPHPQGLDGPHMTFTEPFTAEQWLDCGFDGLCPGDPGYVEPDEGELDGRMQGLWIAGFGIGRPALHCAEEKVGCPALDCCETRYARDALQVNAAVVRQGQTTVAFVALDLVGLFRDDIDRIRAALEPGLEVDLLVVGSTHNHEGPDTVGQWGPGASVPSRTGREPYVLDEIVAQSAAAVEAAVGNLRPAVASATVVDTGVTGLAISDSRTPYIFDDNLPVLRLTRADTGATIATLLSFGNHAEVRWSDNQYVTADYPGATRKYVEAGLPGVTTADGERRPALPGLRGVTLVFAGAVGGLITPSRGGAMDYADRVDPDGPHSWAAMDAVGQRLAMHVLQAVAGEMTPLGDDPDLRFAHVSFLTALDNKTFELAALALGLIRRDVYNATRTPGGFAPAQPQVLTEANVVRLGPLTLFTAPGEAFPETLGGGYPGKARVSRPVVGDVAEHRVAAECGPEGLPTAAGTGPCVVRPDQENPPDWSAAPNGPYVYERVPGALPFFIGLGGDFLGYMVPRYDYQAGPPLSEAPGDHYEETNSIGPDINADWERALDDAIRRVP